MTQKSDKEEVKTNAITIAKSDEETEEDEKVAGHYS
jgi:hypothetical protein